MDKKGLPGIIEEDAVAATLLIATGTIGLGVFIPITCVMLRYESHGFNFFHAFLFLTGISVGTSCFLLWHGHLLVSLGYLLGTMSPFLALYKLTHVLHKKIEETKQKDRP